ncbi:MAG: DUF6272 family protein [Prochlorothrix sp.]
MSLSYPQSFGEVLTPNLSSDEYLTIQFSPDTSARQRRWRNYGLSADFLGDYFATFFPGSSSGQEGLQRPNIVKAGVSYIANELLENAMKFNDPTANRPISISLFLYEDQLLFDVMNHSNADMVQTYTTFIQTLLQSDIDELYMSQLEKAATGEGGAGMGLLTMVKDYSARLGWLFTPVADQPELIKIHVMATLAVGLLE